jgi:hypothetical protein
MSDADCSLCGKPILNPRRAWRESKGWVSPDGAKGMTLAKPTGQVAHAECVSLAKHGVSPEQGKLL